MEREKNKVYVIPASQYQFKGIDEEAVVCDTFGCRKHLTLDEQRMGKICFSCSQLSKEKPDAANFVVHFKRAI